MSRERKQILNRAKKGKAQLSHPLVREYNDDKEIVMAVIENTGYGIDEASERLQKDRDVFMLALGRHPEYLPTLPIEVRRDLEANLLALTHPFGGPEYVDKEILENLKNKEFALKAVSINGLVIKALSDEFKDDYQIAKAAVKENDMAYEYVSNRLKDHLDIVTIVVKEDGMAKRYVSEKMMAEYERHAQTLRFLDYKMKIYENSRESMCTGINSSRGRDR